MCYCAEVRGDRQPHALGPMVGSAAARVGCSIAWSVRMRRGSVTGTCGRYSGSLDTRDHVREALWTAAGLLTTQSVCWGILRHGRMQRQVTNWPALPTRYGGRSSHQALHLGNLLLGAVVSPLFRTASHAALLSLSGTAACQLKRRSPIRTEAAHRPQEISCLHVRSALSSCRRREAISYQSIFLPSPGSDFLSVSVASSRSS